MKATVAITFKPGVLDPEAQAIHKALSGLGFAGVKAVSRTRVIELALEGADASEPRIRLMCDKLLANPVIEAYRILIAD